VQTLVAERQSEIAPEQIEEEIRALDWRDLQLWGIGFVVLTVVATGLLALVMPQIVGHISAVVSRQQNIAQLIFGLLVLLVLLNVYLFQQRVVLLRTRRELIVHLQAAERTARADALTGVFNRRFMEEALTREVAQAERHNRELSVMLADVDGFKAFNTKFGHLVGDRVLVEAAALLQKNFRAADIIIRYGGDEFLVIMPDTDIVQAAVAVKRLGLWFETWNRREQREYCLALSWRRSGVRTWAHDPGSHQSRLMGISTSRRVCVHSHQHAKPKQNCPFPGLWQHNGTAYLLLIPLLSPCQSPTKRTEGRQDS
jgi:diguanylate cyclase (GGDEF)-like protein